MSDPLVELFAAVDAQANDKLRGELPRVYTGPDGKPWAVPGFHGVPSKVSFANGASNMAEPVAVTADEIYKATFIFNAGRQGTSENYNLALTGVADPYTAITDWAVPYIRERRKLLQQNCKLEALRISDENVPNDSRPLVMPQAGLGDGLVTAEPAPYDDGFAVILSDASRKVKAKRAFGMLSKADLSTASTADRLRPEVSQRVIDWVAFLATHLKTTFSPTGGGTVVPVIGSYDREIATEEKYPVKSWELDANGYLRALLDSGTPVWERGQAVKVTNKRTQCVRGLSGAAKVLKNENTVDGIKITLDRRYDCPIQTLTGVISHIETRTGSYYAIANVGQGNYGTRILGRAFFVLPGHQKQWR